MEWLLAIVVWSAAVVVWVVAFWLLLMATDRTLQGED